MLHGSSQGNARVDILNVIANRRCCMARIFDVILAKSGNPENYSHPEFISVSFSRDAETSSA